MEFFTQYKRPEEYMEYNSGEEIVEKSGYVEPNIMIENMIFAGQRLDLARSEMYDFKDEESVDEDFDERLTHVGVDPSEISVLARNVGSRMAEQRIIFEKEKQAREEDEKKQFQLFKEQQKKEANEIDPDIAGKL